MCEGHSLFFLDKEKILFTSSKTPGLGELVLFVVVLVVVMCCLLLLESPDDKLCKITFVNDENLRTFYMTTRAKTLLVHSRF